jgi:hypothetical protein
MTRVAQLRYDLDLRRVARTSISFVGYVTLVIKLDISLNHDRQY